MKANRLMVWAPLFAVATCGCAETLLGLGGFFGTLADGLKTAGTCLSPLEPIDLNSIFAMAAPAEWDGDSVELTDEAQTDVAAFYAEHLGDDVLPAYYLNERFFELGSMGAGDVLEVEFLSDVVDHAWLYDAEFTQLAAWITHDFEGRRHILEVSITRDSPASFLRVNLAYLSQTGDPIVRLTRGAGDAAPQPRPQSVVLHFSGQTGVTFRSGSLVPTDVAPLNDPVAREAAVQAFREAFAEFNLAVFTDDDPAPPGPFSVIYVGAASPPAGYLGMSELADGRNQVPDDIAIVDINNEVLGLARLFGPEVFGAAIGKVAAHEMGHLLGLRHVLDPDALMTGVGCQGTGLDIQRFIERRFKRAPLYWSWGSGDWAVGYQDSVRYLAEILGPAEAAQP